MKNNDIELDKILSFHRKINGYHRKILELIIDIQQNNRVSEVEFAFSLKKHFLLDRYVDAASSSVSTKDASTLRFTITITSENTDSFTYGASPDFDNTEHTEQSMTSCIIWLHERKDELVEKNEN